MNMLTASAETPVFFECNGDTMFGIHTRPETRRGIGVVIAQGGDMVNVSFQRNQLAVRLARMLAADGYDVIRFDYHGMGESTGELGRMHVDEPFTDDVAAAANVLRRDGIDKFVLIGSCYGARAVLSAAPLIAGTIGVLMSSPPVGSYERGDSQEAADRLARNLALGDYVKKGVSTKSLKQLSDPVHRQRAVRLAKAKFSAIWRKLTGTSKKQERAGTWVSKELVGPMRDMVRAGVPVLVQYGTEDPLLRDWERALNSPLGQILERGKDAVEVVIDIPGVVHGFTTVPVQEIFLEQTIDWFARRIAPQSA